MRRLVLGLPIVLCPIAARAWCPTAPGPTLASLQRQAYVDPRAALDAVAAARIGARGASSAMRAWFDEITAEAYGELEDGDREQTAAERGLGIAVPPDDPVRLALLLERALAVLDLSAAEAALPEIDAARARFPSGSAPALCARIETGLLLQVLNRPEQASVQLLAAYRDSAQHGPAGAHAEAALYLSLVQRRAGEFEAALASGAEAEAIDRRLGLTMEAAFDTYYRAETLLRMRRWPEAEALFRQDETVAARLNTPIFGAYAELGLCETLLGDGRTADAAAACARASRVEGIANGHMAGRLGLLLARVDLASDRPAQARPRLDRLLAARATAGSDPRLTFDALRARADAEAAAGDFAAAYADLKRANAERDRIEAAEQNDKARYLRAEIGMATEAARAADLARLLAETRSRAARQRLLGAAAIAVATTLSLALGLAIWSGRRHRRDLRRLAGEDMLTGLPNRRAMTEAAETALAAPLAVALIDLDHFKTVNDRYGHAAGDSMLQLFASRAAAALRRDDRIGRWGGEEFLVLLPRTTAAEALALMARLRAAVSDTPVPGHPDLRLRFSSGIAESALGLSFPALLAAADAALYAAKIAGRGRDCIAADPGGSSRPGGTLRERAPPMIALAPEPTELPREAAQ